jgi:Arc/MetJ-type ribon-helix-helix transcriptional regulator
MIPEYYLNALDDLVRQNMYGSRSATIRAAVRDLVDKEWQVLPVRRIYEHAKREAGKNYENVV